MNRIGCVYLDIPETFPSPRLSENLGKFSLTEPEDFLGVPFKMSHNIFVVEVIQYPVPQWATPGVKNKFRFLEFAFDFVALELC